MKNLNTTCAFRKGATCLATIQSDCSGCAFAKTPFELAASKKAAYRRIRSLSKEQQSFVSQTYYAGARPWERRET